ncbi:MAG: bifunctional metallophosphatase/5'-nucleotidase [Bacteroidales bacterium]|nr:bifunctional metallophosphatase/5'-nucleotidase [Bacteroidales bacterium]
MKNTLYILTAFLFVFSFSVKAQSDTTKIIILHTNDMHSKIDMLPQMAYQINKIRENNDNVLLVSAGDNFTGNPIVDMYKDPGYPMIDLMNLLGFEIACLGNHEFDYGQATLNDRMFQANFYYVCANIKPDEESVLRPIDDFYKLQVAGVSLGFVGFIQLDKNMMPATNPIRVNDLIFTDALKIVKNYETYQDSADVLFALSHLGIETDEKLAKKAPFFDAIIGGHSHTRLFHGIVKNDVLIAQAGGYGNFLGVMTLLVVDKQVVSVSDSLIALTDDNLVDEKIKKVVDGYNENPEFDEIIGYAYEDITGKSELGALMTDAMLEKLDVDIAFQNEGGIRVHSIPAGEITKKEVLELSPFGNTFVIYELTVNQIKKLVEYTYKLENQNEIQVSGIEIYLIVNKKGKLKNVILTDDDKQEIANKTYKVAINDYMANSYELSFLKNPVEKTSVIDAECTMEFLKNQESVYYSGENRVHVTTKRVKTWEFRLN